MALTPSPSDLAVVLCHGSYHSPAPYHPLLEALRARGMTACCPHLPTSDLARLNVGDVAAPDFDRGPPPGGYPQGGDDAAAVLGVVEPLIEDEGKRVLLVAHSSGGWVASQVARAHLGAAARAERGLRGGIIGILYVGAFVIPVGESVNSFFQPKDGGFVTPPFMTFHKHGAAGLGTMVEAEKFLFNDVAAADARRWAATLTASPILTTPLTNDAYASFRCAYLVLDGDLTLPREYQEAMVAGRESFTVYHCPAGHSPHLSWTEGVADTVEDFVRRLEQE